MEKEILLEVKDLHAFVEDTEILKGINLTIRKGESHAIMGLNGAGKSTLSNVIMGHPDYRVTSGDVLFGGKSVLDLAVEERARLGLYLSFQYPQALPGITISNLLRSAMQSHNEGKPVPAKEFRTKLKENMSILQMDPAFLSRYVNDGFSGGEKKRAEILQMAMLEPKLAILDETDSGLDIDALRIVAEGIAKVRKEDTAILLITHYQRILQYLEPDFVHVLVDGRIVKSGDKALALELEEKGYDPILKELEASG